MDNIITDKTSFNLVMQFFINFSRFEYALKRLGFVVKEGNDVKISWNEFADKIKNEFEIRLEDNNFEDLKKAVNYIIDNPPRKLVIESDGSRSIICWRKSNPNRGNIVRDILILVARIRNNLFHGEKPGILVGGAFEQERENVYRDKLLLEYGLIITKNFIELDHHINKIITNYFHTPFCENLEMR